MLPYLFCNYIYIEPFSILNELSVLGVSVLDYLLVDHLDFACSNIVLCFPRDARNFVLFLLLSSSTTVQCENGKFLDCDGELYYRWRSLLPPSSTDS